MRLSARPAFSASLCVFACVSGFFLSRRRQPAAWPSSDPASREFLTPSTHGRVGANVADQPALRDKGTPLLWRTTSGRTLPGLPILDLIRDNSGAQFPSRRKIKLFLTTEVLTFQFCQTSSQYILGKRYCVSLFSCCAQPVLVNLICSVALTTSGHPVISF